MVNLLSVGIFVATQILPRQTRVRYIIQEPMYGGTSCPNILTEVKHCNNLTFCEGYYWDMGTWSKCALPPHKIPQCGQGLQARGIVSSKYTFLLLQESSHLFYIIIFLCNEK